jgi:ubiquinone/menaquinone biosynthesis C-methylase UbiE
MPLNIIRADMRHIPFADDTFSFVYSYNAIFFMTKPDIARSMSEIERVIKPDGLCCVNFMSVDDPDRRTFCETAFARRLLKSKRFAHFEDNEADKYFTSFEILYKEKRLIDKLFNKKRLKQARVEYIARKKKIA